MTDEESTGKRLTEQHLLYCGRIIGKSIVRFSAKGFTMQIEKWEKLKEGDVLVHVEGKDRFKLVMKDEFGRWIAFHLDRKNRPTQTLMLKHMPEAWNKERMGKT